MPTASVQIIVARDEAAYFRRAVDLFSVAVRKAGNPSVALSGGSTPKTLFELLAGPDVRSQIPWERLRFFWGDERCVPPDHPDSNYGMAREALLSRVPVPRGNIHRMKGELDPQKAADAYQAEMEEILTDRPFPRLDLNLLGMGEDGHTASLFPGTAGMNETRRWVVAHHVEKLNAHRLTMTFPVFNNARRTLVMVTGAAKADVIAGVLSGVSRYPIEQINPVDGELTWLLDAAAAQKLPVPVRAGATYI